MDVRGGLRCGSRCPARGARVAREAAVQAGGRCSPAGVVRVPSAAAVLGRAPRAHWPSPPAVPLRGGGVRCAAVRSRARGGPRNPGRCPLGGGGAPVRAGGRGRAAAAGRCRLVDGVPPSGVTLAGRDRARRAAGGRLAGGQLAGHVLEDRRSRPGADTGGPSSPERNHVAPTDATGWSVTDGLTESAQGAFAVPVGARPPPPRHRTAPGPGELLPPPAARPLARYCADTLPRPGIGGRPAHRREPLPRRRRGLTRAGPASPCAHASGPPPPHGRRSHAPGGWCGGRARGRCQGGCARSGTRPHPPAPPPPPR